MNTTLAIRLCAAALGLLLSACASTPRWDKEVGDTVRAALAAQVANPRAAFNTDPVNGIDGHAAQAAQENYEKSYKEAHEQSGAPASMVGNK